MPSVGPTVPGLYRFAAGFGASCLRLLYPKQRLTSIIVQAKRRPQTAQQGAAPRGVVPGAGGGDCRLDGKKCAISGLGFGCKAGKDRTESGARHHSALLLRVPIHARANRTAPPSETKGRADRMSF